MDVLVPDNHIPRKNQSKRPEPTINTRKCTLQDVQSDTESNLNTNSRMRQNNYQLYVCLTNSINNKTKRILANKEQGNSYSGQPCGVTYLKLLIQKVKVDRATASHIQRLFTQLDVYMIREAKSDIVKFNKYVSDQMSALASRGETSNDVITNLFTGYMACTDKRFVKYMDKYKDNYKQGEDIIYQGIMLKAKRKYQA
jgi:hypothetical protein